MSDGLVQILDGNTFVVSDARGDIEASPTDPTGLFAYDTRFLSRWILSVNGTRLSPLSTDDLQYFATRFFLVPGTGTVYVDSKLSVIRERAVSGGFHEELRILNHDAEPANLTVRLDAGSDFADLFEVKDALQKQGNYSSKAEDGRLSLIYERETLRRETTITASPAGQADDGGMTFDVQIEPHGSWKAEFDVATSLMAPSVNGAQPSAGRTGREARATMERGLDGWL